MFIRILRCFLVYVALAGGFALRAQPRVYAQETAHFRVIYYSPEHEYLVPLVIRSLENALQFYERFLGYHPSGKVTILIQDFGDVGYGSAGTIPNNFVQIGIEPDKLVYETMSSAERTGLTSNHELMHVVMGDKTAPRDDLFRLISHGKILPNTDDPVSIPFSFLGSPRVYSPRWFNEGGATFMETWMGGGFGRALGGYDEMMFRTMVREGRYIYDLVGLESEGTSADFQGGANSYLYGTRFMNYLAYQYGPKKLMQWLVRNDGSRGYFESEFRRVYGLPLHDAWKGWVEFERGWQANNIKLIGQYPVTRPELISSRMLGSVSRTYYDQKANRIYAAVRHTGRMAYLAAFDPETGQVEHLTDVTGPALYYVTSLAFDQRNSRLFFTTNNNDFRGLSVFNLKTRKTTVLARQMRVGELVFNQKEGVLWGVRHSNGLASLMRIEAPFEKAKVVYTFPYPSDFFDLDISPDGKQLTGGVTDASGSQRLIRFKIADLLAGNTTPEVLHEFGYNSPGSFTFSPDGRYLYGSSYITGVSNLFRFDLETRKLEALSNSDTGLFRPLALGNGSLAAVEYSGGFRLVRMPIRVIEDVNAIPYLGQAVVEKYPELKTWQLPSRDNIHDSELRTYAGYYRPFSNLSLKSIYPIVQGYNSSPAGGVRMDFADPLAIAHLVATLSYSPDASLALRDRIHLGFEAGYWGWGLSGYFNRADFYDLFGPTKVARRGFGLISEKRKSLLSDDPRRLDLIWKLAGYSGLNRLPEYQNVVSPHPNFLSTKAALEYTNTSKTIGAVEDEKGVAWNWNAQVDYTFPKPFLRTWGEYDRGFLTPLRNSSIWVRSSAGAAFGEQDDPFASFYFGAFGNNWVDKGDFSRYREYYSFPGVHIDQLGGRDFGKSLVEWNLPPHRFRDAGSTLFYCNWVRPTVFAGALATTPGNDQWRGYLDAGAQVDFRLVIFTYAKTTFSTGFAAAHDRAGHVGTEFMASLKLY